MQPTLENLFHMSERRIDMGAPNRGSLNLRHMAYREANRALVWIGRSLLILSAVSLITMPLTQQLWTWDHFLHGGQDFELTALMILNVLCLVLVISQRCKGCIELLVVQRCLVIRKTRNSRTRAISQHCALPVFRTEPKKDPASGTDNIPLRI